MRRLHVVLFIFLFLRVFSLPVRSERTLSRVNVAIRSTNKAPRKKSRSKRSLEDRIGDNASRRAAETRRLTGLDPIAHSARFFFFSFTIYTNFRLLLAVLDMDDYRYNY